jgi:succinate-acetate transporter protein
MSENTVQVADNTANPAPLGLFGFALTTALLNIHNAGFTGLDSMILAMGIFYGGLGQIMVGYAEWKKNNTFGTVAFTSYGLFWLTLVSLILMPKLGMGEKPSEMAMGIYLGIWGLFSFGLWIGTFRLNRALQVTFGLVVALFWSLMLRDFTGSAAIGMAAGWIGIACAGAAFYTGMAQVLNPLYGKELLPLGAVSVAKH